MLQEDSSQHNNKAIDVIKLFSKNNNYSSKCKPETVDGVRFM